MINVLFVCLGNICRSPMAEAIFAHQVREAGLEQQIGWDSAGTSDYHPGEQPDWRTCEVLAGHGVAVGHAARQIREQDYAEFDYILAMDRHNLAHLQRQHARLAAACRVERMGDYGSLSHEDIPDPYYGDLADFETVYHMLEPACRNLLNRIRRNHDL